MAIHWNSERLIQRLIDWFGINKPTAPRPISAKERAAWQSHISINATSMTLWQF
jgi:hypothetical protein